MTDARLAPATVTTDLTGYVTGWSEEAVRLFGHTAADALGQHLLFLQDDDDTDLPELPDGADQTSADVLARTRNGHAIRVELTLALLRDPSGDPTGMQLVYRPRPGTLTDADRMRLYARIIEDSHQGVLVTDTQERIVMVNAAFTHITGYSADEAIGQTPDLLRSGRHDTEFRSQVQAAMKGAGLWFGEILGRRKSGEIFPQSVSISAIRNDHGEVTHAFSIFSDITNYKETEARLQRLVNFDSVTGLPNRLLLGQLLGQALSFARRHVGRGAVLVIQLQRLGWIYDSLGHDTGDHYMAEVARRLREALREQDILARLSHDKLAIALLHIPKREHAALVGQKLLAALDKPFMLESHSVHAPATLGISLYPENGMDTAALLRSAELANTRAHENDLNLPTFFSDEMNERVAERFRIESELRHAIAHGELRLHHQPKVSLRNGRIVGAEALLRWQHPTHGMVLPSHFVPVAEETGLILELGDWVLREACRQIRDWNERGLAMPPLAINLSARQFNPQLPGQIDALLMEYGVQSRQLRLEITESLVVRGAEEVIPIMNTLVAMGLGIALDDFGTGYSSLAYLKRFPINTLKIDRAFVVGIPHEPNDCAIAQAIVTMGQQLRQEIVAEGVETREQMVFLRNLGCDQLQGYLFSPPVPAEAYERMMAQGMRLDLRS